MGWRKNAEIAKGAVLGGGVGGAIGWGGKIAGVAGGSWAGPLGWGVFLAAGIPSGDSCISASKTCHVIGGCAC